MYSAFLFTAQLPLVTINLSKFYSREDGGQLSDHEENDEAQEISYEGGIPILSHQLSEMERSKAERDTRDDEYKDEQIRLNRRLVAATVALVISTIMLGFFQVWYMHRQWKLTSSGLSKMGDQIWAAKDAAYAAKAASDTAFQALQKSQEQFNSTLSQMRAQTAEQGHAASAAKTQAENSQKVLGTTIENFRLEQRAWVVPAFTTDAVHFQLNKPIPIPLTFVNLGRTPAKKFQGLLVTCIMNGGDDLTFDYIPGGAVHYGWRSDCCFPTIPNDIRLTSLMRRQSRSS